MPLTAEEIFFMGPCLIDEDNRFEVVFTVVYSVDGMK